MTPERVLAVLEKYEKMLGLACEPYRWPAESLAHDPGGRARHILWMCGEARKLAEAGKVEKAMRWLGFIQGVLWADGFYTIEEMKDDNR